MGRALGHVRDYPRGGSQEQGRDQRGHRAGKVSKSRKREERERETEREREGERERERERQKKNKWFHKDLVTRPLRPSRKTDSCIVTADGQNPALPIVRNIP